MYRMRAKFKPLICCYVTNSCLDTSGSPRPFRTVALPVFCCHVFGWDYCSRAPSNMAGGDQQTGPGLSHADSGWFDIVCFQAWFPSARMYFRLDFPELRMPLLWTCLPSSQEVWPPLLPRSHLALQEHLYWPCHSPPKPGTGSPFTSNELLVPAVLFGQCTAFKHFRFVLFCAVLFLRDIFTWAAETSTGYSG